jgi:hypothetical protein
MDEKTQVEILTTISKTHRSILEERTRHEWKVLISTLTIYAFSIAGVLAKEITVPGDASFNKTVWGVYIVLALIATGYFRRLSKANKVNQDFAHAAENKLMELSGVDEEYNKVIDSIPNHIRGCWALAWQVATLFLFATAASYIITCK